MLDFIRNEMAKYFSPLELYKKAFKNGEIKPQSEEDAVDFAELGLILEINNISNIITKKALLILKIKEKDLYSVQKQYKLHKHLSDILENDISANTSEKEKHFALLFKIIFQATKEIVTKENDVDLNYRSCVTSLLLDIASRHQNNIDIALDFVYNLFDFYINFSNNYFNEERINFIIYWLMFFIEIIDNNKYFTCMSFNNLVRMLIGFDLKYYYIKNNLITKLYEYIIIKTCYNSFIKISEFYNNSEYYKYIDLLISNLKHNICILYEFRIRLKFIYNLLITSDNILGFNTLIEFIIFIVFLRDFIDEDTNDFLKIFNDLNVDELSLISYSWGCHFPIEILMVYFDISNNDENVESFIGDKIKKYTKKLGLLFKDVRKGLDLRLYELKKQKT